MKRPSSTWTGGAGTPFQSAGEIGMRISLKTFAKLDKARTFGNTFVELNRGGIALVGQPMDLAATVGLGGGVDKLDQLATHAAATLGRLHPQVLQVAGIFDAPVGAVIDEVDHAHRLAVLPGQG